MDRFMPRWAALIALVLVGPLFALTPLAHATPQDETWIAGIYDGADYDDVVGQITSEGGPLPPLVLAALSPPIVLIGPAMQYASDPLPNRPFERLKPRAPPAF